MKLTYSFLLLFFSLNSFALTPRYCRELTLENGERGPKFKNAVMEVNNMVVKANGSKAFVKDQRIGSDKTFKLGDSVTLSWKGGRANMKVNANITQFCAVLNDDFCVGVSVKMANPEHERYNGIEIDPMTRSEREKCWSLNFLEPMTN